MDLRRFDSDGGLEVRKSMKGDNKMHRWTCSKCGDEIVEETKQLLMWEVDYHGKECEETIGQGPSEVGTEVETEMREETCKFVDSSDGATDEAYIVTDAILNLEETV